MKFVDVDFNKVYKVTLEDNSETQYDYVDDEGVAKAVGSLLNEVDFPEYPKFVEVNTNNSIVRLEFSTGIVVSRYVPPRVAHAVKLYLDNMAKEQPAYKQ